VGAPNRVSYSKQCQPCKWSSLSILTQLSVVAQLIRLVKKSEAKRGLSSKLPHEIWAHAQQSFCDPQHDVHNTKCACTMTAGQTRWAKLFLLQVDCCSFREHYKKVVTITRRAQGCAIRYLCRAPAKGPVQQALSQHPGSNRHAHAVCRRGPMLDVDDGHAAVHHTAQEQLQGVFVVPLQDWFLQEDQAGVIVRGTAAVGYAGQLAGAAHGWGSPPCSLSG
jgi:hypothetical protein